MSTVPEITKEQEKTTNPQNNQQNMSTSPEIAQKKANPASSSSSSTIPVPEPSNPPAPLNTPMQPTNPQNQQIESSAPKNQDTSSSVPEVNPPELDDPKQPTNPQKQEKLQSAPEISPEEAVATPLNPPHLGNSAQTNPETTDQNPQKSDQTETPKKDSTSSITTDPQNEIPKQDSTTPPNPQTETPKQNEAQKQDSTNVNSPSQLDSSAQATSETTDSNQQKSDQTETPNKDSITTEPQNESPKQDSTTTTDPQTEIPKQNEAQKQDSTNVNTPSQLESSARTTSETTGIQQKSDQTETPNKDSTASITTEPQNETPKQDSTSPSNPQTETPKENEAQKQDSTNVNDPPAETDITDTDSKKMSLCTPLAGIFGSKEKKTTSGKDEHSKPSESQKPVVTSITSSKDELAKSIDADIQRILEESNRLGKYKDQVISLVNEAKQRFDELKLRNVGTEKEFRDLKKEVIKLKLQIPSQQKSDAEEKDPHKSQQATGVSKKKQKSIPELVMKQMPQLHKSTRFENSAEVKDFESLFNGLSMELKLCLLCFSVFPENAIIKKRLMVYWWIAEGLIPPIPQDNETRQQIDKGKTAEEFADEYFEKLTKMGFIEPVNKNRSFFVGCYTLHPFVRLALIMMAEKAKFFNFDEEGNPTEKSSDTFQACLMGRGLIDYQDLRKGNANIQDLEKLHAVFNVNEPILDFKPEWFSMMKNLNVLYLGTWKVSATDHIEVEESNFLDGLSNMDHLKFFSLQGVSRIVELPESIEKLSNLIIMDLRACPNLESIPERIHFLKNLTYLDISECYLLEHMPKGLAMLSNVRVLKGFVVGKVQDKHTCTLDDLAKLEKLVKLSIYTGLGEFPTEKDLSALQRFKVLKKLTMAWGGEALHPKSNKVSELPKQDERKKTIPSKQTFRKPLVKIGTSIGSTAVSPRQLEKLEKLDLKSFPKTATPSWLTPSSLKSLKKLYIRGGKFSDLGQYQDHYETGTEGSTKNTWKVEILRLKYLSELEMDWRELQGLFPNLIYLEKVNCPKLSFFASDGYGVWINKDKLKQMQVRS